AVFILWSRLGSPTGPLRLAPDGRQYRSGTEREWELMWQAREHTRSLGLPVKPEILVYTRDDDDSFHQRQRNHSDEVRQLELEQKLQVGQFIREEFQDAETGRNLRAYHTFNKPVSFAQAFRGHLTRLLESLIGQATERPVWDSAEQGPPFRGLQAFEYEHAGIFFGREDEIVSIRSQLREQACRNCAFLLISGGSGSGKSSLARAGVMPDICQHELNDTLKNWVPLTVRPGDLGDRPLLALLQLLQSPAVLPALSTWSADLRLPSATGTEHVSDAWLARFQIRIRDALGAIPGTNGPQRLLLLVDQLEEFFTSTTVSAAACSEFFAALETLARSGVVWVLATVRSDFYHECQKHPALVRMKRELGHFDLMPP
ncbi:MAG: AAA family ATPase, partial [Planctomycetaceae bacterium]